MKVNETTVVNANNCNKKYKSEDEPLIPANKSKFWAKILDPLIYRGIEANFHTVRVKNKENYYQGNPEYGRLIYGSHNCFHDGQVAYYICKKTFNSNFYLMIQELYKLPILSRLGGFSVEKDSAIGSLRAINYSSNLLKDKNKDLWIFPQGRVMPPDYRPIKFQNGLAYIANKVKNVNLIPVSVRYTFVRDHKPEILAEFGEPIVVENGIKDKKEFTSYLEENFTKLVDKQREDVALGKMNEYEIIFQGNPPLFKKAEPYLKWFVYDKRFLNKMQD